MTAGFETEKAYTTIGAHPVLDFLDTVRMVDGGLQDALQTDADVVRLLGMPVARGHAGLLIVARELRDEVRRLIERRKDRKSLDLSRLNRFLEESQSHRELRTQKGALVVERVWAQETSRQVLGPLAEAAAELLAQGDFNLIRRCEGEGCVLWFYDRTKSHRRRWCSMETCGNRHKVAAFRQRQTEG